VSLRGISFRGRKRPAHSSPIRPIGQSFFAPELVIQHQEAIGLSAEQKEYLKTEIRQAHVEIHRVAMETAG